MAVSSVGVFRSRRHAGPASISGRIEAHGVRPSRTLQRVEGRPRAPARLARIEADALRPRPAEPDGQRGERDATDEVQLPVGLPPGVHVGDRLLGRRERRDETGGLGGGEWADGPVGPPEDEPERIADDAHSLGLRDRWAGQMSGKGLPSRFLPPGRLGTRRLTPRHSLAEATPSLSNAPCGTSPSPGPPTTAAVASRPGLDHYGIEEDEGQEA